MLAASVMTALDLSVAPAASADPHPVLAEAVNSARAACGGLRYDPLIEQAADIVNRSTLTYVNHTAENVPADDPQPTAILADLGIPGSKVMALQGAGTIESNAIHGVLIEGYQALTDCGYTDFGASMLYEPVSGYNLAVVVLVGP